MKNKIWLLPGFIILHSSLIISAHAQGTAFSYQGKLNDGANPATGLYDVRFSVCDALTNGNVIAGPLTNTATGITNGLFSTVLDFGAGVFTGPARWLQLDVRTNGTGAFTPLAPRELLLAVPYAVMANSASNLLGTLPATQLSGTLPPTQLPASVLTNNQSGLTLSGTFSGNGVGLTNVSGGVTWQNMTGTSQQAQPNTGYLANNSAQVTITLPASPNLGDIVRVSGVGAGGWIVAQYAGQAIRAAAFGINYTNWNTITNWVQASAPNTSWYSVASSADGNKLVAVVFNGGIYISTNAGATWTLTSAPSTNWTSVASSADGTKLAAVVWGSGIYNSTNGGTVYNSMDSGATWTQANLPSHQLTVGQLMSIASSVDGMKLVALGGSWGDNPNGVYTSTNAGVGWIQTSAPIETWSSVACSADGNKLVASPYVLSPYIYTSTNAGANWTPNNLPVNNYSFSVASSADGNRLVAGFESNSFQSFSVYISTNSAAAWMQTSVPVNANPIYLASSADGSKLIAVASGGGIYTSINAGVNWIANNVASANWICAASSSDGTRLVAAVSGGGIYTAQATIQTTTTPGTSGYLAGGQNSAIELQYIGNGQWLPLSYVGAISAY